MSYSFNVRGATKALVLAAVAVAMAEVVKNQPVHAHDAEAVQKNAETYVNLLPEVEGREYLVSANGYLSWREEGEFTTASGSVSAYLVDPE